MESANFLHWFEKLFLPSVQHLTSTAPVILFFDGHHSHMSIRLVEQEFLYLLAKLWDRSFLPQHFTSGFRRTGLCPLSRDAIPTSRLTKALPCYGARVRATATATANEPSVSQADQDVVVELVGTCTY